MGKATATQLKKIQAIIEACEARYGRRKVCAFEDFIESLVYQILELAANERQAREALKRIRDEYTDWNDMRVASVRELQDILGPKYPNCREKAEDLHSLLADLYTAFRRMDLTEMVRTPEGIETLRALPETTLIREDMVERALLEVCRVRTLPCDEEQWELLLYLGGLPKSASFPEDRDLVEDALDGEAMLRLSRGLREHCEFLRHCEDVDGPRGIGHGWDQPDPLKPARSTKKTASKKTVAQKPVAKKAVVKKTEVKKTAAKKDETKKAAVKKTEAKKTAAKKAAPKQPAASKTDAQKTANKQAASKKTAKTSTGRAKPPSDRKA